MTSDRVALCLVGCGGMGSRHILGLAALQRTGLSTVDLVAVCDLDETAAQRAAGEAEELLGRRPKVHLSIADAVADPDIAAFDVVTEASSHLAVTLPALRAGKHVLSEKPLGITVRSCLAMVEAAAASGAVLATAENYRRDPPNRLVRAVLDAGLLGEVFLAQETRLGGSDLIITTPWRHLKDRGAIGLDMGVHLTDVFQYYFGPIASVYGDGFIAEPVRRRRPSPSRDLPAYRAAWEKLPEQVTATGEDSVVALYRMESGVRVQLSYVNSGLGKRYLSRSIHGRLGSLEISKDRSGRGPVLHRDGATLTGREILAELPDFALDDVTSALFGADGVEYDLPAGEADAGGLAIELHDFGRAVLTGTPPEVDGEGGTTAVAGLLGAYESGLLGRPVTMKELLDATVSAYQDPVDAQLGLTEVAR
ncbi:Gfo/Idh/MocA family protein [Jiangella mangrovi]|uniref:Putative dehydrogenase n=1 Tax=Jiangella mangrovi TaxID=1524084 RepID=A0A7W9GNJ1_9ACTN|nr:Gfo/Idh/MocA family oxidoreductase [Jiangella mangrovi]MBB5786938.1 putative dehydrogenase [Jiangella mangrovi]